MTLEQVLQQEIKDTEVYLNREQEESVYKLDLINASKQMHYTLNAEPMLGSIHE